MQTEQTSGLKGSAAVTRPTEAPPHQGSLADVNFPNAPEIEIHALNAPNLLGALSRAERETVTDRGPKIETELDDGSIGPSPLFASPP